MFFQTQSVNKIMITLVMLLLKMVVEEVALETLIFLVHSQIYLKIFLEKDLVEVEDVLENQIIEDLI